MFQGILIFSDWMFKKKIIVFPHLFLLLGEKDSQKLMSGVLSRERGQE